MRNEKLIPFEVLEKAVAKEPEAIHFVLCHYRGYIKYRSVFQGHFNADIQDRLEAQLIKAIFQFRFDR
ncbi:helix-turn-helix domain-containing protein [Dielma fastidiosa]|uniref:Helix-turn-helix protein n=1 Tax=Dielma fastidiosa TaxID=1034346 RepID=A0A318KTH6_9FIRM|nr:helix-turn-helix domain-containing protein [Dielma fastidiosa]PXX79005.1 helix-turn-helix protein [Dielma fastidiosa]RHN02924.1 helix-turn-helix domain-containing protein [Dielma fastidiosa]HAH92967.1 helix-turn-helix domain-containing protein [Dielma fastidiosa]